MYSHGTDVIPGTEITISFSENGVTGSGECYSYTGLVDTEDSLIEVEDVVRTEKPCENVDGIWGQHIRFADVLKRLTFFRIYGDRLFMRTENYEALLFRAG